MFLVLYSVEINMGGSALYLAVTGTESAAGLREWIFVVVGLGFSKCLPSRSLVCGGLGFGLALRLTHCGRICVLWVVSAILCRVGIGLKKCLYWRLRWRVRCAVIYCRLPGGVWWGGWWVFERKGSLWGFQGEYCQGGVPHRPNLNE